MLEPELPTIDDLDELVGLVKHLPSVFLRYSKGPAADAAGPSHDYEAGVDLPGLSTTTIAPEPWWPRPAADWVARRLCKYSGLAAQDPSRRPWLLTGQVAGYGPDHEPLVIEVMPVAWIGRRALRQASERYRDRFEVGQDSTG